MCDMCSDDPKWKSAPSTEERRSEIEERTKDLILKHGHQVTGILDAEPPFFYTEGRSIYERPELLLVGPFDPKVAMAILNTLAHLDNSKKIDLVAAATGEPFLPEGFGCPFKFAKVDPNECEMYGAVNIGGPDLLALQVIWPDAEGRWPDDPEFAYGPDAQPLH